MVAQKRFKRLVLPLDMEIKQVSEFQACNDSPHLSTALLISSVTEFVQSCESIDANLIRNATLRKLYGLGVLLPNSLFAFENILNWFKTSKVGEFCSAGICNPFTALADGKWIRVLLWKNGMSNAIRWTVLWCSFDWKSSSDAIFTLQQALQDLQHDHLGQQLMFTSNEDHARAPEKIWKALEDAKTLYQAVEMLGMPKSWLQYWLQKDRDLVKHWQDHIDRAQVSEISTRIHSFLSNNPDVSSSKLRELFQSDLVILRRKAPDLHQIYNSVAQSRNKNTQIRLV
jgi:hypothetical protein